LSPKAKEAEAEAEAVGARADVATARIVEVYPKP